MKQNIGNRFGSLNHCLILHKNKLFSSGPRYDCTIRVWDTVNYDELTIINLTDCWVNSLVHDDTKLYAGMSNGSIHVWNIDTYQIINILNSHLEGNDMNSTTNSVS